MGLMWLSAKDWLVARYAIGFPASGDGIALGCSTGFMRARRVLTDDTDHHQMCTPCKDVLSPEVLNSLYQQELIGRFSGGM